MNKYKFNRIEIPISQKFTDELVQFWESIFQGERFAFIVDSLVGKEVEATRNVLYFVTCENMIVSTLRLTHSKSDYRLGCLGEAATLPEHRGNRLMGKLLEQAIDEFVKNDGQTLFLATANQVARKIYQQYGFDNINGYDLGVMLREKGNANPDDFFMEYFETGKKKLELKIEPLSNLDRITMVPFIIKPHEWIVLDSNLLFVSSKYRAPYSCEGIYVRCQDFQKRQNSCFVLRRSDGAVTGFASAGVNENSSCCIEAFTLQYCQEEWLYRLYKTVADWANDRSYKYEFTTCAKDDKVKKQTLEILGFESNPQKTQIKTSQCSIDLETYRLDKRKT